MIPHRIVETRVQSVTDEDGKHFHVAITVECVGPHPGTPALVRANAATLAEAHALALKKLEDFV